MKRHSTSILALGTLLFSACMKEPPVMGVPTTYPYTTIGDIRKLYQGADVLLSPAAVKGTSKFTGIVISDPAAGNMPAGKIVLQSDTTGIVIALDPAAPIALVPGDSVVVTFSGGHLVNDKGMLQISGLSPDRILKAASGRTVAPRQLTAGALSADFARYESTLVTIAGADVLPTPGPGETYKGSKGLYDGSAPAGTIKLFTENNARFADSLIPGNANFTGIAAWYNAAANTQEGAEKQIRMRHTGDVVQTSIPLGSPIIITGYLSDSRGADGPVTGAVSGSVTHAGGYEYIQLMAVRDIDFSVTPYSVVTCNNGTATVNGWAEGGATSFKFNLSSGQVAKGSFFYVGGPSKVIAGYNATAGKSTDISNANWIRTINYNAGSASIITGDGFGNSTGGLLGNVASDGSNTVDGIAVFEGTAVTAGSVPLDAVFYGTKVGNAFNATAGTGYRVPANDHYNPIDPESGAAQPFFGQGSNTYLFAQPGADKSDYSLLGGVLTTNAWIVPREATIKELPLTAVLADIQQAAGVTFLRP